MSHENYFWYGETFFVDFFFCCFILHVVLLTQNCHLTRTSKGQQLLLITVLFFRCKFLFLLVVHMARRYSNVNQIRLGIFAVLSIVDGTARN